MNKHHPYSRYLSTADVAKQSIRYTPARIWERDMKFIACIVVFIIISMGVTTYFAVREIKGRAVADYTIAESEVAND